LKIYDQEAPEVINLLEDVLFEIRDSLIDGDAEGLKKLLRYVPIKVLIDYLPDEVANKHLYRAVKKLRNEGSKDV
jgi:peptide subunit release factor RF-3